MNAEQIRIPKKPDKVTLELLVRARLFLSHAISHSSTNSTIDRMVAIHGLDNTLEFLIRIIIQHLDIETLTGKNLDTAELASLAGEVDKFLHVNCNIHLPYLTNIKLIRKIRNLVQHGMMDPQPDIERCVSTAEKFFDLILDKIFGLQRDELRLSTIISNQTLRKFLSDAEKYIETKDSLDSVLASRNAFENALYHKTKHSNFKLTSIPALVETKKANPNLHSFLSIISEEFELSRLGVNLSKYQKYCDYLHYLPSDIHPKNTGWAIKDEWTEKDAKFCYEFVSETIIKWETDDLPFNDDDEIIIDNVYSFKDTLGGVDLSGVFPGGCHYYFDSDQVMELKYIAKSVRDELITLKVGRVYEGISLRYKLGNLDIKSVEKIKLLSIETEIFTTVPERWEALIWLEIVPFSRYREKYNEKGEIIEKTPCINTATVEELKDALPESADRNLANKIVSLREISGKIKNKNDLKKIKGITEYEISWICHSTYI